MSAQLWRYTPKIQCWAWSGIEESKAASNNMYMWRIEGLFSVAVLKPKSAITTQQGDLLQETTFPANRHTYIMPMLDHFSSSATDVTMHVQGSSKHASTYTKKDPNESIYQHVHAVNQEMVLRRCLCRFFLFCLGSSWCSHASRTRRNRVIIASLPTRLPV